VLRSVTPGQQVVKIVNDALVDMLGADVSELQVDVAPPAVVMMVGLQGSGKTTTTAKLAKRLKDKGSQEGADGLARRRPPGAQEQLAVLGRQADVATLADRPWPATRRYRPARCPVRQAAGLRRADARHGRTPSRRSGADGRDEGGRVRLDPHEVLLVVDALTGQDAVNVARNFSEQVELTGVVLTRMDGDARGGAALSMRAVTGKPIKFAGVGEGIDKLEAFHPSRVAGRILGMGDVVGLVERAAETIQMEDAEALAKEDGEGPVRPERPARAAHADAAHGRARRACRHDAGHEEDGRRPLRRRRTTRLCSAWTRSSAR
jgi:signal recognition particle subunit SRP54